MHSRGALSDAARGGGTLVTDSVATRPAGQPDGPPGGTAATRDATLRVAPPHRRRRRHSASALRAATSRRASRAGFVGGRAAPPPIDEFPLSLAPSRFLLSRSFRRDSPAPAASTFREVLADRDGGRFRPREKLPRYSRRRLRHSGIRATRFFLHFLLHHPLLLSFILLYFLRDSARRITFSLRSRTRPS